MKILGLIKTTGIVTKTTKYGETSLIVTILTRAHGKISAIASNARSKRSRMLAGLQLFSYSEIVMYKAKSKNGLYNIDEMNVLEGFNSIRSDLDKMAYAAYFADAANGATLEDESDDEVLRLLLNTLYAVDRGICNFEKIKMAFEWKLAAVLGYAPELKKCGRCGDGDGIYGLSLKDGTVFCKACVEDPKGVAELSDGMRKLIEYIIAADSKQIFSFDARVDVINYLSRLSEAYLSVQLDKQFVTLDYLKKVRQLGETDDAKKY